MANRRVCAIVSFFLLCAIAASARGGELDAPLEAIRAKHKLPALGAAVIVRGELVAVGAVGVRKSGSDVPVTADDKFHIGSCTKAMTATLIAKLIEQKKLPPAATLAEAFPELADEMQAGYRAVTLKHLLSHRAGLSNESWPTGMSFIDVHRLPGAPPEQRYAYVKKMLSQPQAAAPGEKYIYANSGYTVAAVMAERATGKAWEDLMREHIFAPLGMKSAGFGAMGTPGKVDQPWQHRVIGRGEATPIEPGPHADNPPSIGPGGTVHCTLADWAKFVQAHLAGARGNETLVGPESFRLLHTPTFGGDYAQGWVVTSRDWGDGNVLTHAGSNNQNYAVVWMAPAKNFAVLAVTNQGGDAAAQACDDAAGTMIQQFLLGQ